MVELATTSLAVGTALAAATFVSAVTGWGHRAVRRAGLGLVTVAAGLATAVLGRALWRLDLSLTYVADHARRATSAPYRLAGLWGGASGSLLLFTALVAVVLTLFGPGRLARHDERGRTAERVFSAAAALTLGTLLIALQTLADPFARLQIPAIEGGGLQPILEHPAMLYHPPIIYVGLVLLSVPCLRTLAAIGAQSLTGSWAGESRAVLLASWVLLTTGLATGANWAYVELGWGGYWGWDPVENSVLVPWLVTLAALHSLRRTGPRWSGSRRTVGRLNVALVATPWVLVLVGTTLTRSGAGASVHAFADDANLGWLLLGLIGATGLAVGLAIAETPTAEIGLADRRDLVLAVPIALGVVAALIVLAGLLYPLPASGSPLVSGHFFAVLLAPVAALAMVASVVPFLTRPRPGWPVFVAHLGFAVLMVGVFGSTLAESAERTLAVGESMTVGGYEFRHDGVRVEDRPDDDVQAVVATITVWRDEQPVATLEPELIAYPERSLLLAETALQSRPLRDLQVVLRTAADTGSARYEVAVRPLVNLVWVGAALLALGGAAALLTSARTAPTKRSGQAP